jgi:deaminated glutathione amidase
MAVLTIATCQFSVGADIDDNARQIKQLMTRASRRGARVVHFPEGALSGYAGIDFPTFDGFDWPALRQATAEVAAQARQLGIWTVLGSSHQLTGTNKPHNSLYVISDAGELVDRYDKRFCAGDAGGQTGDLAHYSPGSHFSVWTVDGISCGALICHDYRYPELYREYARRGVQLMFHSFHAARGTPEFLQESALALGARYRHLNPAATFTYPGITMPATMTAAAAANHVWISCPNSSAPESCWPAFFVRADGVTTGRLRRNVPGLLISTIDTGAELYDSTAAWRQRAIAGTLHSGELVNDPRSADRTSF